MTLFATPLRNLHSSNLPFTSCTVHCLYTMSTDARHSFHNQAILRHILCTSYHHIHTSIHNHHVLHLVQHSAQITDLPLHLSQLPAYLTIPLHHIHGTQYYRTSMLPLARLNLTFHIPQKAPSDESCSDEGLL